MDDITLTPVQRIEIILTLPWQFGELKDGEACFSEDEIQSVLQHVRNLATSLEAAEADRARLLAANAMLAADLGAAERDAAKWREMHADRDLQHEYARANASEAECEHLTTALNLIDEARANALAECERLREKMSALYRRVDLVDGATDEPVQFVGVYVTRWGESEPTVAFVQWDDDHAAGG